MNHIFLPLRFAAALYSWTLCAFALCLGCASAQAQSGSGLPQVGLTEEGYEDVIMNPAQARAQTVQIAGEEEKPHCRSEGWRDAIQNQRAVAVDGAGARRALSPAERAALRRDVRGAYAQRDSAPRDEEEREEQRPQR